MKFGENQITLRDENVEISGTVTTHWYEYNENFSNKLIRVIGPEISFCLIRIHGETNKIINFLASSSICRAHVRTLTGEESSRESPRIWKFLLCLPTPFNQTFLDILIFAQIKSEFLHFLLRISCSLPYRTHSLRVNSEHIRAHIQIRSLYKGMWSHCVNVLNVINLKYF